MKRLFAAIPFLIAVAGCAGKPCQTSNECGGGEVCAGAHCQALSCSSTYYAIDPADGQCRPLPACGNRDDVRGWASCGDPCAHLDENTCVFDPRCQPVYATDPATTSNQPCAQAGFGSAGPVPRDVSPGCGPSPRNFLGCRANPLPVDPCKALGETACKADPRCVAEQLPQAGCPSCPPNADCLCAPNPGPPTFDCRVKTCVDFTTGECAQHPECASQTFGCSCPPGAACDCPQPPPPQPNGLGNCFPKNGGSCNGMDEGTCLAHPECHPVGGPCYCPAGVTCVCGGGAFLFCEPDDGLRRCNDNSECDSSERCSNDEVCAPPNGGGGFGGGGPFPGPLKGAAGAPTTNNDPVAPPTCAGLCVPKGCAGYAEKACNNDPTCQPIYQLQCSPYGGGGGGGLQGGPCGGAGGVPVPPGANGAPIGCGSGCEPSFVSCVDAAPGSVVDPERSILLRDPTVVDDPSFAFPTVMAKLSGAADPAPFVERWLNQVTQPQSVDGRAAAPRLGAAQFLSTVARRADGRIDLAKLGFQTTSLSNRLDLAGPNDCGEARVTYALSTGVGDRRHRMTVIVELGQPDDGAQCMSIAKKWVALSSLSGASLLAAVKAIYSPLLAPQHLNQVRTNEFLVGPETGAMSDPWELREWHLGLDGDLHLALSKQAVDPTIATTDAFTAWVQANSAAVVAGTAQVPAAFLAVTSSENGSRISVQPYDGQGHPDLETALNKNACAGCHTTETNSAFAHVAERWHGTGRAQISEFLIKQLPVRGQNLFVVAQGHLTAASRATAVHSVH